MILRFYDPTIILIIWPYGHMIIRAYDHMIASAASLLTPEKKEIVRKGRVFFLVFLIKKIENPVPVRWFFEVF